MPPAKIFALSEKQKSAMKVLKKIGAKTTKDLIGWQLLNRALDGDLKAIDMVLVHMNEPAGFVDPLAAGGTTININMLKNMDLSALRKYKEQLLVKISDAD